MGEKESLLLEAASIWELQLVIDQQIEYYANRCRHSTLVYTRPMNYISQEEIPPQSGVGLGDPSL
jgi:hypothetical protein